MVVYGGVCVPTRPGVVVTSNRLLLPINITRTPAGPVFILILRPGEMTFLWSQIVEH